MTPKEIGQQLEQLQSDRAAVEIDWRKAEKYCYPQAANSEDPTTGKINKQDKVKLVDSTGIDNTTKLAKALVSFIVPPNWPWVGYGIQKDGKSVFKPGDKDPADKRRSWLSNVSKLVQTEFNLSNFGREINLAFRNNVVYGIGSLLFQDYWDTERERMSFHFTSLSPWEIFPVENQWGVIDQMLRLYKMNGKNIKKKWPDAEYDENFNAAFERNPFQLHEIVNTAFPNEKSSDGNYSSQTILKGKDFFLEDTADAFDSNLYITFRYERLRNRVWGNSPAIDATPFLVTLNDAVRMQMGSWDSIVNGRWVQNEGNQGDSELDFSTANVQTVVDINNMRNLAEGASINGTEPFIQGKRFEIDRMLGMEDIEMPAPQASPVTAFETRARLDQQLRQHAPLFGAIRTELLSPLSERALKILRNREKGQGRIEDFPSDLNVGEELVAVFKGPLAKAQQIVRSQASDTIVAEWANVVSAAPALVELNPEIAFLIDLVKVYADKADALGVDPDIFIDKATREAKVAELMQQRQAQQQAQVLEQTAGAAKDLSQAAATGQQS